MTEMGRRLPGKVGDLCGLGIADRTERKSSDLESPASHKLRVLHTNYNKIGLAQSILSAEVGSPQIPGEAEAFIL